MPEEYRATDKRTGLEVTVRGDFPEHPQDRIRIARTANLFTKLTHSRLAAIRSKLCYNRTIWPDKN